MEINVAWSEGVPTLPGLYLVAIELGENSGYNTFMHWDGVQWGQTYPEKVIAFCAANEFLAALHIKWPKPETLDMDNSDLPPLEDESYLEYDEDLGFIDANPDVNKN